jgi:hypothetical protein
MSRRFPRPWSIVLEPLPQYRLAGQPGERSMGLRADYFRQRAAESREQAERSLNHADKEHWLTIAEEWLKMAQQADLSPE